MPRSIDVLSQCQLRQLATSGYVSLDIETLFGLQESFQKLFAVSQQYFALDSEDDAKKQYRAPKGSSASEEGFSVIAGEKQIFTCRGYARTPSMMNAEAKEVWDATGRILQNVMGMISRDLQLSNGDAFEPLMSECLTFQKQRTPTLLRLFRYDRPQKDSSQGSEEISRVVAEKHKDLGLLSIVVGSTAGLEVLDELTNEWISIEEPGRSEARPGNFCITLLAGQTLRFLSRGQYKSGVHRVRCSSRTNDDGASEPFRYSIVYALRPFPNLLDLFKFESPRVGVFTSEERTGIDGQSAQALFSRLCNQHWNVNITQDIREKQKEATAGIASKISKNQIQTPGTTGRVLKGVKSLQDDPLLGRAILTDGSGHVGPTRAAGKPTPPSSWTKLKSRILAFTHHSSKRMVQT